MKIYSTLFIVLLISLSLVISPENDPVSNAAPANAESLYNHAHVWNVNLRFSAPDWEAVSPKMASGLGPLGFFAPGFIKEGDSDGNNQLSREEFITLGKNWFTKWDDKGLNHIDADQIEKGIFDVVNGVNGGKFILAGSEGERNGLATVLGVEFPSSPANMEFEGQSVKSVSVRNKGNGTFLNAQEAGKLSYKIDMNDGYPGRNFAGVVKFNLHNCITDPTFMIEVLSYKLFRDAGVPAPRTSYARLHISVVDSFDQKYYGLYSVVENVDKQFVSDRYGSRKGVILKPVTPFLFKDLGDDWEAYHQIYDPKTSVSDQEKAHLINLCKLVTNSSDTEFATQIGTFIDLDELARFLAVTVLICDLDGFIGQGQNFYMYLNPKTNRFIFIPWDQDHSFGQFKRTQEQREQLSILRPWDKENHFLDRLFRLDEFKSIYLSHLKNINSTLFQVQRFKSQVDELAVALRAAVGEESPEKLELFTHLVSWDANKTESAIPEGFQYKGFPGGFGSEPGVKPVQGFVAQRSKSVEEQLEGKSTGLEDESTFTMGEMTRAWGFSSVFITSMDANKDGNLTFKEFDLGFTNWYNSWSEVGGDGLTTKEIRAGLNAAFTFPKDESGGS